MAQHGGTEEEAINEFQEQVKDAWEDINNECLSEQLSPRQF